MVMLKNINLQPTVAKVWTKEESHVLEKHDMYLRTISCVEQHRTVPQKDGLLRARLLFFIIYTV